MAVMVATAAGTSSMMLAVALPCIGAVALVLLLRIARFPLIEVSGRAIVAGTIAGLLLGPSVFGRVFPDRFESIFIGGIEEREAAEYAHWLAMNAPAVATRMTVEGRAALVEQGAQSVERTRVDLERARAEHQRPMRLFTLAVVAAALLASALRVVSVGDRRQGALTPLSIGCWSFALPAATAYVCAVQFWDHSVAEASLLAAAVAIGPWTLGVVERQVADGAEFGGARMMQTAGRVASTLAIATALWSGWHSRGFDGVVILAPLAALPLAWCAELIRSRRAARLVDRGWARFAVETLLAIVATLVAMKIDLHAPWAWATVGALVAVALIADDGRWLGAFLGAMLPGGRPALRTMRLVMPAMAAGSTQLAVAALALGGGLLPDRSALPLLAGAILIEVTAPGRRQMAARLIETEQAIDEQTSD